MGLTSYLENPMFDAIGSLLVGGLLGGVASFIIYSNVAALVGRSISQENLDKINAELEADIMVQTLKIIVSLIDFAIYIFFLYFLYAFRFVRFMM